MSPARRRRGRRAGRLGAVVGTAVVLAVAGLPALPASAGTLQWNEDGASFATFGPNAYVSIDMGTIAYECDHFTPTADIYVVPTGVTHGQSLSDVSGAPNTVDGASGGLFVSEPIAITKPSGTLAAGTYAVVYDECQDGKVDAVDSVFDPAFRVELPAELPPVDPMMAALKHRAAVEEVRWLALLLAYDSIEAYGKIKGTLDCIASGVAGCLVQMALDEAKSQLEGAYRSALGLQDVKEAARDRVQDVIKHYEGIRKDPPDPTFLTPTVLPPTPTLVETSAGQVDQAQVAIGNAAAAEGALAGALLRALERYQGADAAGDATAALEQARAASAYAALLAEQTAATSAALTELRTAATSFPVATPAQADVVVAERERVATYGLTLQQSLALQRIDVTGAEQDAVRAGLGGLAVGPDPTAQVQAAVDGLLAERAATRSALEQLHTDLESLAATVAAEPSADTSGPQAEAGGPYTGSVGAPLVLAGAGGASYAWDLDGDGGFDDAAGASASVVPDAARHGLIGLQVTDAAGRTDVDYARLDVTDPNSRPSLALTPQGTAQVTTGQSLTVTAAASDPDGDPVELSWTVDGVAAGTGSSLTVTPDQAGVVFVGATATDSRGARTTAGVDVLSVPVDADSDGYPAHLDCDDQNPDRSPGNVEQPGDGIDNDCDDTTGDSFSPPGQGPIPPTGTYLRTSSNDTGAVAPAIVDLAAAGIVPGDDLVVGLRMPPGGWFSVYPGCWPRMAQDDIRGSAVFSSSAELLPRSERYRVPGAIDAEATEFRTGPTYYGGLPTDIPEDFYLGIADGTPVQVPQGAAYLFLQFADVYYSDNCGQLEYLIDVLRPGVPPNSSAPVAADDAASTPEDTPLRLPVADLLANDSDADGDALSFDAVLADHDARGTAVLDGDVVLYTPAPGFVGTASFDYAVTDVGGRSDIGTVTVNVTPVNEAPVAGDDAASTPRDVPLELAVNDLLANDSDADGDALTLVEVADGASGTVQLDGAVVRFTPAAGHVGEAAFSYTVSDPSGLRDTAQVSVLVTRSNAPPVAQDDAGPTTPPDTAVLLPAGSLLANDSDPDGDALVIEGAEVVDAANGSAVLEAGGVRFTPSSTSDGQVLLRYGITDGVGGHDVALVTVTVSANTPPECDTVTTDLRELWPPNHTMRSVLLRGGSDPDGDQLALAVTSVTQDEHTNGLGDGDTGPADAARTADASEILLRAERDGRGDGRVYRIGVAGDDGRGGTCSAQVVVGVPKSMKPYAPAVDSGSVHDSFGG